MTAQSMISHGPIGRAKSWLEAALGFFYPEVCQSCGNERAAPGDGYLCGPCRNDVSHIQAPFCERCGLPFEGAIEGAFECSNCRDLPLRFTHARAAVVARGLVLDIIHQYKYQQALWFEPFLAGLLVRAAQPHLNPMRWDMIVPVPLHPLKHREREFNQSERLARRLGRATGLPVRARLLRRVRPTDTQTHLTRAARTRNVRAAFDVRSGTELKGRRVVLVDDVLTTGATTSACAVPLLNAGAAEVCVWTLARGLLA